MQTAQTFVLVHGSWHDGSAWSQVANRLGHHGHNAFGPTVAGHGKAVSKKVSHVQSTQSIVDFIVSSGLTDIVLVGHSYGGTIISKVAEAMPDRIRRLVYWSGFVLNDGECLNDVVPPHFRELFRDLAGVATDAYEAPPMYKKLHENVESFTTSSSPPAPTAIETRRCCPT